jgi:predicted amidohydrolase YtcJ
MRTLRVQRTTSLLGALSLSAAALATPLAAFAQPCPDVRDLLLRNGVIHTMDANDTIVEAVRIIGDRVAATGRGRLGATRCTEVIDLVGRTVVPGLIDNHNHIVLLGLRPGHDTRLESAASIADVLDTRDARGGAHRGAWITSIGGFDINQFVPPPGAPRFPTLAELDSADAESSRVPPAVVRGTFRDEQLGKRFFERRRRGRRRRRDRGRVSDAERRDAGAATRCDSCRRSRT